MPVHVHKTGIRALGISESFVKGVSTSSVLAGVVVRADRILDGFSVTTVTVGGMDATQQIIELYHQLNRDDINLVLLNGCIISWYNVIDLHALHDHIPIPLICVTYEDSEGIERYFRELFPTDGPSRISIYQRNGPRTPLMLHTGKRIYVRCLGLTYDEAKGALNKFTLNGAVPEPLRIARLLARSIMKSKVYKSSKH